MRTLALVLTISAAALVLAGGGGAAPAATVTLTGTVGPGFTITLKNHGKAVKTLAPAKFAFVITDKSNIHNFHLTGPGVNRKTSVERHGHDPLDADAAQGDVPVRLRPARVDHEGVVRRAGALNR